VLASATEVVFRNGREKASTISAMAASRIASSGQSRMRRRRTD